MKRKSNHTARSIWIQANGPIPRDVDGYAYEVHHIDGNPKNNDISNLKLLTIRDHLEEHIRLGDWGAVSLISKRLNMGSAYASDIQRGKKRPGVGGAPKGRAPWNKGVKGCFTSETVEQFKQVRAGRRFGVVKLTDQQCADIIELYLSKPSVPGAGIKSKNGRVQSYETAFSKHVNAEYGVTPNQIYNIITGKRNVKNS